MEQSVGQPQFAWQPLTARGVAAFGRATVGRLLVVQFVFALVAAASVLWVLQTAWFPVISAAIAQLPAEGKIRSGTLEWHGDSPRLLAEDRFLAFAVDLKHAGGARSPAHIGVEFGQTDFKLFSLFGFIGCPYPKDWSIAFNRPELQPRWGAWAPVLLALTAGLVIVGLMLSWALLATLYSVPAWLVGLYANRDLSLREAWRLAGAVLMPGALFMSAAILVYGLGALDVVRLLAAGGLHLVVGWVYLFFSPLALPRHPAAATGNPFAVPARPKAETRSKR